MTKRKIGINGVGRIGRTLIREYVNRLAEGESFDYELVAINNPGNTQTYAHLIKYDSVHGTLKQDVSINGETLTVGAHQIKFATTTDPREIGWDKLGVDLVVDATGFFKDKTGLSKHLYGTVKKVIMCAPGKELDGTFVMGINHEQYNNDQHHVISNASCTTNCLSPVAKVLEEQFGISSGFMTTVHAYTSDQNLLDNSHSDLRRARAAAMNMIPTSTGAAKALGEVIPSLKGKLDGYAVRVPTSDVSMVDLTVVLNKKADAKTINQALKEASQGSLKGILGYCDLPLVSQDFVGTRESSVLDATLTNVIDNTVKVVAWYDNEVGFSNRVLDLANHVVKNLK